MSIPDLKGLLETAQRIQSEVARVREELARKTVEGETGGGLCRCTVNGKGRGPVADHRSDAIVGDKKMIEDLAVGAVNIALERARELAEADLAQVTGGLPCRPGCSGAEPGVFASPIARLIQQLAKLPGVGEKTAARLAFHILRASPEDAAALAAAIAEVRQKIRFCSRLLRPDRGRPVRHLPRTRGGTPAHRLRGGAAAGRHRHRAGGRLPRPLPRAARAALAAGRGRPGRPARRRAGPALRATGRIREAILATSPSVEGEATAVYLAKLLRPLGVRATRIATGVPMGGELEYADQATLARAIDGRREM